MNTPYCPAPRRRSIVRETLGELLSAGLFFAAVALILSTLVLVLDAPGGIYLQ